MGNNCNVCAYERLRLEFSKRIFNRIVEIINDFSCSSASPDNCDVKREKLAIKNEVTHNRHDNHFRGGEIYFLRDPSSKLIKIGFTSDIKRRMKEYEPMHPGLELLLIYPGTRHDETELHLRFMAQKYGGKWFVPEKALLEFIDKSRTDRSTDRTDRRQKHRQVDRSEN